MRTLVTLALTLALVAAVAGCDGRRTDAPVTEAPATPSEATTSTPSTPPIDGSRTRVAVVLPPLLAADKTDDDIVIEAAKDGIFDVEINSDRSITYRMTMDERDAYLQKVTQQVDADLASLVDGPDPVPSFRSLEHDSDYRHFTIEVDADEWDSVHSFWSMEIYKWAMKRQAVSGTPLDDLQVVVDFVDDSTGAVIHTNDSKAEGA